MGNEKNYSAHNGVRRRPLTRSLGALAGGTALAVYGITRRSPTGYAIAAAGGSLIYYGSRSGNHHQSAPVTRASVLLNTTPDKAYQFWRDFENLPRFMRHLDSVTVHDDRRSRWIARGPAGSQVKWDAEIIHDRPNEYISWRSLPGSDVDMNGFVQFRPAHPDRGTVITAELHYHNFRGALALAFSKMLLKDPQFLITQDLRRFKALLETGEVPTTEGQTHGPRSALVGVLRIADPDRSLRRESKISEVFNQIRRTA